MSVDIDLNDISEAIIYLYLSEIFYYSINNLYYYTLLHTYIYIFIMRKNNKLYFM